MMDTPTSVASSDAPDRTMPHETDSQRRKYHQDDNLGTTEHAPECNSVSAFGKVSVRGSEEPLFSTLDIGVAHTRVATRGI